MENIIHAQQIGDISFQKFADELTRADHEVFSVSEVLRGERSAIEAYTQVMKDIDFDQWDPNRASALQSILQDHKDAASFWERFLRNRGELADLGSGPWGIVVETFVAAAKIFGDVTAFKVLKEGEEHGLHEYKSWCDDANLSDDNRRYIQDVLIPAQMRHIGVLTAMTDLQ